jgi:hypothetical protein
MPAAFYRCPVTAQNILMPTADGASADGRAPIYKVVTCSACNRGHVVNLKSGEVHTHGT